MIGRYSKLAHPHKKLEELQRLLQNVERNQSEPHRPTKVRSLARRLGQATVDHLVADYVSGAPTTQLMAEHGISKTGALKLLAQAGVPMRRQSMSLKEVEEAAVLYRSGLSLAKVSERTKLPLESIRRALIDAGVKMRPRGRVPS